MSEAGGVSQIYKKRIQIAAVISHKAKSGSGKKVFIYLITQDISDSVVIFLIWRAVMPETKRRSGEFSDIDKTRTRNTFPGSICHIIVLLTGQRINNCHDQHSQ